MQDASYTPPFKTLGTHLRYLREKNSESVAEVSGAVEIHEEFLERIEEGVERPNEEILMLLISHFNMPEGEAVQLWELAGYDRHNNPDLAGGAHDDAMSGKSMVMLLAIDVRTQYTDGVEVALNDAGVVMTFTQAGGMSQPQPIARVGMSLQQAEAVSGALEQALLRAQYKRPKGLPSPRSTKADRRQDS